MLHIFPLWRIRHIKFQKQSWKYEDFYACFQNFIRLWTIAKRAFYPHHKYERTPLSIWYDNRMDADLSILSFWFFLYFFTDKFIFILFVFLHDIPFQAVAFLPHLQMQSSLYLFYFLIHTWKIIPIYIINWNTYACNTFFFCAIPAKLFFSSASLWSIIKTDQLKRWWSTFVLWMKKF